MRQLQSIAAAIAIMIAVGLTASGCHTVETPQFAKAGIVNNPVRDTLYIYLKDFEDEWVNIRIQSNNVDYSGRDQVVNGKAWFDIGHLPTGNYTVWIEFGQYRFTQHIRHTVTY